MPEKVQRRSQCAEEAVAVTIMVCAPENNMAWSWWPGQPGSAEVKIVIKRKAARESLDFPRAARVFATKRASISA
ncbi:MAG: hypothetical protein ACKV2V_20465 [Blastocatellia bacterium]